MTLMLKRLSIVCFLMLIAACGSIGNKQDSAPKKAPNVSSIPNAVPRDEPRSKYGNPASYVVFGKRYYTLKSSQGFQQKGIASWYGTKFHGKRTSSGEPYDMYAMTAAHKTLPLPSYVEVTNLDNGRKVIVKVNDRGPFHGGRIIDLSYSAATKLGIIGKGTGNVEVKAISADDRTVAVKTVVAAPISTQNILSAALFLQMGAFSTQYSAEKMKLKLQNKIEDAVFIAPLNKQSGTLYRVRIGPLDSTEYGNQLAGQLLDLGFHDAHIVVE
ncbi:septal ring lytic transglycosylase RlpA family protein [Pseudomonadota bacterium]|nr:septal ring lytic transglycosylase RlpA family protein [Pseudomonadota bacterium]